MSKKRFYIMFVSRDDDGRVRKIPLPLHYVYGFMIAALVGTFTIVLTRRLLYPHVDEDRELQSDASGARAAPQELQADGTDCA